MSNPQNVRTVADSPEAVLRLVNDHYPCIETERRGCKFALGDFGIGVDFAQGIFLAHPRPIAQLPK